MERGFLNFWMRATVAMLSTAALGACQSRAVPNDPVVAAVRANDVAAVERFLQAGGNANLTDREGNPLLYLASGAQSGLGVAADLIAAGADLNGKGATGRTPLENALGWCDVNMVQMLLTAGASADNLAGGVAERVACAAPADSRAAVLDLIDKAIAGKK